MIQKIIDKAVKGGLSGNSMVEILITDDPKSHVLIFSHDFLKAYFGEERMKINPNEILKNDFDQIVIEENGEVFADKVPAWQYHAQQLVLSEDRIAYLEKFL
ncbi:MAG: hypothetical protein KAJ10_01495 [Thermodesulfovibrionia bacterium]|nr:hypothetical protein [Thermodesulfovibrionia bacterium]